MEPTLVAYYTLSTLSVIGNAYVIISLLRLGSNKSCFTFLLFCFHLSIVGESLSTIPHIYDSSFILCEAVQFFHFYFSLMNIVILALLVESHRSSLLEDFFRSRQLILKYGLYVILLFPIITVLPFTNGGYGSTEEDDNQGFCVLSFNRDATWEVSVFFVWVWLLMLIILLLMAILQYRLYHAEKMLAKNLFSTIGLYVIVGITFWIPRSFERMARYGHSDSSLIVMLIAYYPVDISGILYTLIFLYEQRSLEKLHEYPEEVGDLSFTWEKSEIWDLIRNSQTDALKTSFASVSGVPFWRRSSASTVGPRPTITHVQNPINFARETAQRQSEMVNYPSV